MLTVIMPTRDNEESLRNAIETLRKSTEVEYNLIIADDTDVNSIQAMNRYMKKAKGDVLLVHDDMNFFKYYGRDWLQVFVDAAQSESVGILTILNGGGVSGPEYVNGLSWCGTWCTYIPYRTLQKVGFFDDSMRIGEDIDYCYRISKAGLNLSIGPFYHEHHQKRASPHTPQGKQIIDEAALYFRKKHKLGEFAE